MHFHSYCTEVSQLLSADINLARLGGTLCMLSNRNASFYSESTNSKHPSRSSSAQYCWTLMQPYCSPPLQATSSLFLQSNYHLEFAAIPSSLPAPFCIRNGFDSMSHKWSNLLVNHLSHLQSLVCMVRPLLENTQESNCHGTPKS